MDRRARYERIERAFPLPVFFQSWYLDLASPGWDHVLIEEDGEPALLWVFRPERKAGVRMLRNAPLVPYSGPLRLRPAAKEGAAIREAMNQLDVYRVADIKPWPFTDLSGLNGFEPKPQTTFLLDLEQPEPELFTGIKDSRRSLIRKAAASLTVHSFDQAPREFSSLHRAVFTDKDLPYPFDETPLNSLIETAVKRKQGLLLGAENAAGKCEAFLFAVCDNDAMYLLLTATDKRSGNPGALSLLVWEAIRRAKQASLKTFDFEGSSDAGIATFFRSFGGARKDYFSYSRNDSVVWRWKKRLLG